MHITIKPILTAFLILTSISVSAGDKLKITIHISGYADKPRVCKVMPNITMGELRKLCVGVWGNTKRLTIIRLKRRENSIMKDPGQAKNEIIDLGKLYDDKKELSLKSQDVIYVPLKQVVGR